MRTYSIIGLEQQNFGPYAHIDAKPGFDDVRDVVHHAYKDDRARGLVVEDSTPQPISKGEQLRDLINNAEGIDEAGKRALMYTAVNALATIIKQPPVETFQPKSASHHVNRR